MEIAEHVEGLREQGDRLADAAERAGLAAAVPPCPTWRVKDLLRHAGYIHRWAASHLTERPARIIDGPPEAEILAGGAADPELLAWFRAGHAALAEILSTADPGLQCATFLDAPSPLAFWARRQAHETAVHRADAESASGVIPAYPARFAADGIDELIMGFGCRRRYRPSPGQVGSVLVQAADAGDAWLLTADAGGFEAGRGPGEPGQPRCVVTGPASGLYLYLWNRCDAARADVTVTGDPALLTSWQSSVRVRWD
jgi:uncharacterized protein (TIGR03083 family)